MGSAIERSVTIAGLRILKPQKNSLLALKFLHYGI